MIPALTREGLLPPGVHGASLDEIVQRFGAGGPVCRDVAARLRRILASAIGTGHLRRAFVWGSFVTAKAEPADVDIMLVMSAEFRSERLVDAVRKVFDGEAAERELGATVLWTREDVPPALLEAFLEQWQLDRAGRRRGIVEVMR